MNWELSDGRPPLYVGLDIGGTKIEALVVDDDCRAKGQAIGATGTTTLVDDIVATVQAALQRAGATVDQVAAVGAGIPGQVDQATNEVRLAVNLNLPSYPLGDALKAVFHCPIVLENDVRLAAVGLQRRLQLDNMVYLGIGTGISAGLILNGQLYRGHQGMAGEIGHIIIDPAGVRCNCGQRGCLETLIAGPAVVRQAQARGLGVDSARELYGLVVAGNKLAQTVANEVGRQVARAVQWLIMTYDVEKVVLGGGVTSAGPAFLDPVLAELARLRAESHLARVMLAEAKIDLLPAGDNPGPWGAVSLARQAIAAIST